MNRKETRRCSECKYDDLPGSREPCTTCVREWLKNKNGIAWEPKEKDAEGKRCDNCKYHWLDDEPCISCEYRNKWEPKEEKMVEDCHSCKHEDERSYAFPCKVCKWEPKEDDMENKNTTTKIDTEAELKAQVAKLQEELEQAKEKNEDQRHVIDGLNSELARKTGMVEGLKFAIRCNGVSGGEV